MRGCWLKPQTSQQQCLKSSLSLQVDFDGGDHPIEGAKEVGTLMTRYVSRAVRNWQSMRNDHNAKERHHEQYIAGQLARLKTVLGLQPPKPMINIELHVAPDGRSLTVIELK